MLSYCLKAKRNQSIKKEGLQRQVLLVEDKFRAEMNLRQSEFTSTTCRLFTKTRKESEK